MSSLSWTFSIGSVSFGILDIIVFAVGFISLICGFAGGFSRIAFRTMGYILTFPISLMFVIPLRDFLSSKVNAPVFWLSLASYCMICLVVFSLFKLLGNLLGTAFTTLHLGWVDSLLGAVYALVISVLVICVLLELCSLQTFVSLIPLKENSIFYTKIFLPLFPTMEMKFKGALLGI